MTRRCAKVAVSIPGNLLARIEILRKRAGETRSAVFERALAAYVVRDQAAQESRLYVEAYRRRPETPVAQRAVLTSALEALATEPWDA